MTWALTTKTFVSMFLLNWQDYGHATSFPILNYWTDVSFQNSSQCYMLGAEKTLIKYNLHEKPFDKIV